MTYLLSTQMTSSTSEFFYCHLMEIRRKQPRHGRYDVVHNTILMPSIHVNSLLKNINISRRGQVVSRKCLYDIDPDRSMWQDPK